MKEMKELRKTIEDSLKEIIENNMRIDLEISLQIELIIKLRGKLDEEVYKIIPEQSLDKIDIKKEIDIVIENTKKNKKYAIELKLPNSVDIPYRMSQSIVDIKFLEQLKQPEHNFTGGFFILLTNKKGFWEGTKHDGVYNYFRNEKELPKEIKFPSFFKGWKKEEDICKLDKSYKLEWKDFEKNKEYRYLLVEV